MIILSIFDGISCGRLALDRAGIKIDKYYASEIDPYAEKISASNWSDIIRLGDITKWREWKIDKPDMIIAGSPCQGFSRAGKGLNFEDPRSKLFFVFADILRYYHPKYFLLENVKMKPEWNDTISTILGDIYPHCVRQNEMFQVGRLEPVLINSALVSAQNRERLYWCNWKVTQPKDKKIMLKDIIQDAITERDKSYCIDANYEKSGNLKCYQEKGRRQLVQVPEATVKGYTEIEVGQCCDLTQPNSKTRRGRAMIDKSNCLCTSFDFRQLVRCGGNQEPKISEEGLTWRKLTVTECERLQTLPDGYCRAVSNSRAYHAIGNGWTVDVIAHIFRCNWRLKQFNIPHSREVMEEILEDNLLEFCDI